MRHRLAATLLIASLLAGAGPAAAQDDEPKARPREAAVMLAPVGLPVIVDGRLVNYVFVTLKLHLSPDADITELQAKEPYFRDALIRAGARTPFVRRDSYVSLDHPRLLAATMGVATRIAGPGTVVSAEIIKEQAQHYVGLPKPSAAAR